MDLRTFKILVAVGMLLYGSLYLTGVFVIASLSRNGMAADVTLASAGLVYLCFYASWMEARNAAAFLNGLGIVGGIVAGILVLMW